MKSPVPELPGGRDDARSRAGRRKGKATPCGGTVTLYGGAAPRSSDDGRGPPPPTGASPAADLYGVPRTQKCHRPLMRQDGAVFEGVGVGRGSGRRGDRGAGRRRDRVPCRLPRCTAAVAALRTQPGRPGDAEDVASEAWLQIARDLPSFRGDGDVDPRLGGAHRPQPRARPHPRAQPPAGRRRRRRRLVQLPGRADTAGEALDAVDRPGAGRDRRAAARAGRGGAAAGGDGTGLHQRGTGARQARGFGADGHPPRAAAAGRGSWSQTPRGPPGPRRPGSDGPSGGDARTTGAATPGAGGPVPPETTWWTAAGAARM